ncbi:MAG TPA: DinB family protein, partial [Longimicrobiales bacterium]|nr:DinB family protein [Longimicrobiales bacterium]
MPEALRPAKSEYAPFYQGYVERVPEGDIRLILRVQLDDTLTLLRPLTDEQAAYRYAPGKWSVLQVVGHLIDAERIFVYRATCVARGDRTPLPGFDENTYAEAGDFDQRALHSLIGEWEAVRHSTAAFFQHLPDA